MDRRCAEAVLGDVHQAINLLNESIVEAMALAPEEEWRAYRRQVGHVMAEMYDRLLKPLYDQHPDLEPVALDQRNA